MSARGQILTNNLQINVPICKTNHLCLWLLRCISQYVNIHKEMLIQEHQGLKSITTINFSPELTGNTCLRCV